MNRRRGRSTSWWSRLDRADWSTAGLVTLIFVLTYVSTVRTMPLFAPDTRYYAGMALWFGGDSQASAAQEVAAHAAGRGWESPGADQLFGWGLVQPRVVYPALSTPFTEIFGIDGMAVVPGIATALLVAMLTILVALRWGRMVAILTVTLLCTSHYLLFYLAAMLTESLTALWSAVLLALVWRHHRRPSPWLLAAMVLVTVLSAFTRQATLIPAGAFVSAWFFALILRQGERSWRGPALAIGATAIALQLLQMRLWPGFSQVDQFKKQTDADTLGEAIAGTPRLAWKILRSDLHDMVQRDNPLLILLVLAIVSMFVFWRRSESHLLLGALAAYELYNITNGTPTTFRYGTPGLVFVACSAALLLATASGGLRRERPPAPEAQPA